MIRRPPTSTLVPYTTLLRSDLVLRLGARLRLEPAAAVADLYADRVPAALDVVCDQRAGRSGVAHAVRDELGQDRKSTRLNSSHANISHAVFCSKKKPYALAW